MKKRETAKPIRVCFECLHYEACQAWNIGSLVNTNATNCVNYRASVGKTNADRIRAMSDEELAEWLMHRVACIKCPQKEKCQSLDAGVSCEGLWLDWLKEEVKE